MDELRGRLLHMAYLLIEYTSTEELDVIRHMIFIHYSLSTSMDRCTRSNTVYPDSCVTFSVLKLPGYRLHSVSFS